MKPPRLRGKLDTVRADAIGECIEAAQSVSTTNSIEEFSTGRCASEVKASIIAALEQLKVSNAKKEETKEDRDSKATRSKTDT